MVMGTGIELPLMSENLMMARIGTNIVMAWR